MELINVDQFTATDKRKVIDLLVSNEHVLLFLYEKLFPAKSDPIVKEILSVENKKSFFGRQTHSQTSAGTLKPNVMNEQKFRKSPAPFEQPYAVRASYKTTGGSDFSVPKSTRGDTTNMDSGIVLNGTTTFDRMSKGQDSNSK